MTKINKLHFNGIDYDIGDKDIHDLTAKSTLADNDEFMIADSEDSNVHKKVTLGTVYGTIRKPEVDMLIVGGGGGGTTTGTGQSGGNGGGGGEVKYIEKKEIDGPLGVHIGCGGVASTTTDCGGNGGNSYVIGNSFVSEAHGGYGAFCVQYGIDARQAMYTECRMGQSGNKNPGATFGCLNATYKYGNSGGGAGGVGIAGMVGGTGADTQLGSGGPGIQSDISGTNMLYGGGGGGGGCSIKGLGMGGGGDGATYNAASCNGVPHTGGGGGGGGKTGGNGGSGVVYIRYPANANYDFSGGYKYEADGYKIHKFENDGIFGDTTGYAMVKFLLVGGGGGGAGHCSASGNNAGGGGGGGGVVLKYDNLPIKKGTHTIVIGAGGCGYGETSKYDCSDGKASSFDNFVAMGGGGGGMCYGETGYCNGRDGGNGGGGGASTGNACLTYGGRGLQGNNGSDACNINSGFGGGSGWDGGCSGNNVTGKSIGVCSDIEGEMKGYGGGGAKTVCGQTVTGDSCYGGGCGMIGTCAMCGCNVDATYYGGGGGGVRSNNANSVYRGGNGCQGVFIISYPAACGYSITGGNCCYECNGNCIHIFTSDGTLTVN